MGFCNFDRFLVLLTLSAQCSSRQAASILTFNDSSTCLKFKLNDRLILIEPIHHCLIECFTFIWTRFFYDIIRTSIVEVQSHVFFFLFHFDDFKISHWLFQLETFIQCFAICVKSPRYFVFYHKNTFSDEKFIFPTFHPFSLQSKAFNHCQFFSVCHKSNGDKR